MIMGIPVWFFIIVMIVSLFLGVAIRHYFDARSARKAQQHREQIKQMKKQIKHDKKVAKRGKK